ncbi:hypothetical protein BRCON_0049 [Candidatus Sumerlaea chitinivorans]|uniref:Uncharacterized protein n=1 Tax=Sumerlaea chitinivorans TaxID=2250252 RepID=A0A2Z4Y1M3_SUMC1|nr:hypothetical protein BRCON_0049 [Candidatus Sumerlaea chitinivorans]
MITLTEQSERINLASLWYACNMHFSQSEVTAGLGVHKRLCILPP